MRLNANVQVFREICGQVKESLSFMPLYRYSASRQKVDNL
jgi:hypothetical protein